MCELRAASARSRAAAEEAMRREAEAKANLAEEVMSELRSASERAAAFELLGLLTARLERQCGLPTPCAPGGAEAGPGGMDAMLGQLGGLVVRLERIIY